jgi:hypothetical protein
MGSTAGGWRSVGAALAGGIGPDFLGDNRGGRATSVDSNPFWNGLKSVRNRSFQALRRALQILSGTFSDRRTSHRCVPLPVSERW